MSDSSAEAQAELTVMPKAPRVFLSSTYEDLALYRDHVMRVLVGCEAVFKGMEYFGASQHTPLDECLRQIAGSDLVISLLGTRYGSSPLGTSTSYTEQEIDHAIRLKLPVHVYVLDEERQPVLAKYVDSGEQLRRLRELKQRLQEKFTVDRFTSPEDLAMRIARDLFKRPSLDKDVVPRAYRECAYDQLAEWYDYWYEGHWCSDQPYLTIASVARSYFESDRGNLQRKRILDCACGTGNAFAAFTKAGHEIYGTDGSGEMLLRAAANLATCGLSTDKLITTPVNWTDRNDYLGHFEPGVTVHPYAVLATGRGGSWPVCR